MNQAQILRPLDSGEAFFFMADRLSCMNFVLIAERSAPLDPVHIRQALAVIQVENPLLRVKVVWDETRGLCFSHAQGQPLALECHAVDEGDWSGWIERELERPFAQEEAPLMRCLYLQLRGESRSVLVLCFHHSIADGRSGEDLLRRLLDCIAVGAAATPRTGVEPLPPMSAVFPPRYRWHEQEEAAEQLMDTLMVDYKRFGRTHPAQWLDSKATQRQPRVIRLELTPAMSAALLQQARLHGASVHGALCAAQLMAQYRMQTAGVDQPESATLFLSCPVDLRAYLEPVQPKAPCNFLTSLLSSPFALQADTDFWQLAEAVVSQTRRQLARGEGHLFYAMFGLDGSPVLAEHEARFRKTLMASWQNTMVSNIGQVRPVDSDPAVDAISFALSPMPHQILFNAVSCYRGRLILNVGYDAGKLSTAHAEALVEGMRDALLTAADLP